MFRHFRNVVSNSLKTAKRDYYTSLIMENNKKQKLMWKYVKELLPGKSKPSRKGVLVEGQINTDPKCKANAFNEYFSSIGEDMASRLPPLASFRLNHQIYLLLLSLLSHLILLRNMPGNKFVGLDRLPGRLLRAKLVVSLSSHGFKRF